MTRCMLGCVLTAAMTLCGAVGLASDIGQQLADEVDAVSYQYFLDELLYTHFGDNRAWNGPEHDPARDNILAAFQAFGLEAELHEFSCDYGTGHNVVATHVGSVYPDTQYVVGAHYDSVGNPGADDDASGVAGLLELGRVFSQYETEYTIKLIAFDMEEVGLKGSSAYVADHQDDDIRGMIQLDMISHVRDNYATRIYGWNMANPLKGALAAAIEEYGNGLTVTVYGKFGGSDHVPFWGAGFQSCLLIEEAMVHHPCYHDPCDSVDTPDYITYGFAADQVRSVAGFLADYAGIIVGNCSGDADADGDTDHADLGILLADWGCNSYCLGDLDGDDDTDQADLAVLLADWGCTP